MTRVAPKMIFTPDDLLRLPDGDNNELIDGQLVERRVSVESARVAPRIISRLQNAAESSGTAAVYPSELGYQCFPDEPRKVRRADASVIRKERLAAVPSDAGHM